MNCNELKVNFDIALVCIRIMILIDWFIKKKNISSRIGVTSPVTLYHKFIAGNVIFNFHNLYNSKQM